MRRRYTLQHLLLAVPLFIALSNPNDGAGIGAQAEPLANEGDWHTLQQRGSEAFDRGEHEQARDVWRKALRGADDAQDGASVLVLLEALAQASRELQDPEAAANYYSERVRLARVELSTQDYVNLLSTTARRYEDLGHYEDALALLFEARGRIGSAFQAGPLLAAADLDLARHFRLRRSYQYAERHYLLALESIKDPAYDRMRAFALEDYAGLVAELGRREESERLDAEARRNRAAADRQAREAGLIQRGH